MVELEELDLQAPPARRFPFNWLLTTFFRPAKTMSAVAAEERSVWALPLLLLTVLTLVSVLVAGPLRQEAVRNAGFELPEGFEYMTPEQQEQFFQAQESNASPTMAYVFPGIGALAALWLGWFVFGSILHLAMTLSGSRGTSTTAYNLTAWSSLPFAVRIIVQIVAMLVTRQLITNPGVSGFIPADATGALVFVRILLSMIDIYLIWQVVLLVLGTSAHNGLSRSKAFTAVLVTMVLFLLLAAVPGFISAQLSGLDVTRSFLFF